MYTIVLAEPRKSYRTILEQSLSTSFKVVVATSVAGALRAVSQHGARALIAGLFQVGEDSGLQLVRQARNADPRLIMMVYGAPDGGVSQAQVQQTEQSLDLALFLARTLPPTELADLLTGELLGAIASTTTATNRRVASANTPRAMPLPSFSARADRSMSEDTWAELMHREVSAKSIKKLAAKPIAFDPIDNSWSDDDPTWGELMRTKATPGAVRALVRKGLGLKSKKPA